MNKYEAQCLQMMLEMGENFSQEAMFNLIHAFSSGIARTMALIDNHDRMHELVEALCDAIAKDACEFHTKFHQHKAVRDRAQMDMEAFLRDVFKPEAPNA